MTDKGKAIQDLLWGNTETVQKMVDKGFDINSVNEDGKTFRAEYERALLWFSAHEQDGGPVLSAHKAVIEKDAQKVKVFLDALGAKTETEESIKKQQELREKAEAERQSRKEDMKRRYLSTLPPKKIEIVADALKYEDKEALKGFIDNGFDVNTVDEKGVTVLGQVLAERDDVLKEIAFAQDGGGVGRWTSSGYCEHLGRVADMLKDCGAVLETEKSRAIKDELRQKAEAEKAAKQQAKEKILANKEKTNKLAQARKRVTQRIDKALGTRLEEKKIPQSLKKVEKVVSDKIFGKGRD